MYPASTAGRERIAHEYFVECHGIFSRIFSARDQRDAGHESQTMIRYRLQSEEFELQYLTSKVVSREGRSREPTMTRRISTMQRRTVLS